MLVTSLVSVLCILLTSKNRAAMAEVCTVVECSFLVISAFAEMIHIYIVSTWHRGIYYRLVFMMKM